MARQKYDKRMQTQGRRSTGVRATRRPPEIQGPTRLVFVKTDGEHHNGGQHSTHWPALGADGKALEWTCPTCGVVCVRDDLESSWRMR